MLVTENHGVVDAPGIDVKEQQYMATCYHLLLQVFHTLFAWNGFSQPENSSLLKSALAVFTDRIKECDASLDIDEQVRHSFGYFQNLCSSVPTFSAALSLVQLLVTLVEKADAAPYGSRIGRSPTYSFNHFLVMEKTVTFLPLETASVAGGFLSQSWIQPGGERERGIRFNETLQSLLCIYLQHADVLEAIEKICGTGVAELMNAAKDGNSSTYPTLTRQTFVVFFRVLMDKLEKLVRSVPAGTSTDSHQVFDSRPMLITCLKVRTLSVLTLPLSVLTLPLSVLTLPLSVLTLPLSVLTLPLSVLTLPLSVLTLPLSVLTLPLSYLTLPLMAAHLLCYFSRCVF
ncbi:unnamed protein product [Ranitomeya imitator]|uniref:Uncharacterized protein n=1 Tax=Ranitomeya imitator TaxID=111125 RepID=A0ABN9KV97_9NEOB|nr:unnamed protein product [Ranitomeya imitator]